MPLVKKLIKVGNSRAVVIPPDWLKFYEQKTGIPIEEVLMELNGEITIYVRSEDKEQTSID